MEERAENGGRDARPILARATKKGVAHIAVEIGKAEMLAEQVAVDVGKLREGFVEVLLALVRRGVEDFKKPGKVLAEVRAVFGRAIFDEEVKRFALEDAGVLGEQAEQNADEEAFEVVATVAAASRAS